MIPIFSAIGSVLGAISKPVATWLDGRAKRQLLKEQGKYLVAKARLEGQIEAAKTEARAESDWDMMVLRQQQHTWRDEWMTILISYPYLISFSAPFIDLWTSEQYKLTPTIKEAWAAVSSAPEWYQASFIGVIIATFGLRWYFTKRNPMKSLQETKDDK